MDSTDKDESHHGRRARVRKKILAGGIDFLEDYELLESLLYVSFSRKDTKVLARLLLKKFRTISGVFNATKEELLSVPFIGEATVTTIFVVKKIIEKMFVYELSDVPVLNNWKKLIDYLELTLGNKKTEYLVVLFLNKTHRLIHSKVYEHGNIDAIELNIREILNQAMTCSSSAIIVAHNHPSGCVKPSKSDIVTTKQLYEACEVMNITFVDHIIVSFNEFFSFKNENLI